jgi:hypothetical protein
MQRILLLVVAALAALPGAARGQRREALIIFKDGFTVKGKLIQKQDFITDPASGQSFIIPAGGGFMHLDDDIRRIHFSPNLVQEAIASKAGETRADLITIEKNKPVRRDKLILPGWQFEKTSEWNDRWERTIHVNTQRGHIDLTQRIIKLTPWQTYIMTLGYAWDPQFRTKELGPDFVTGLLQKYYEKKDDLKEHERKLKIARFLQQAGWYGHALKQLEQLAKEHPEAKETAEPFIKQLKQLRASYGIDDIERSHRIGQHEEAQKRISGYFAEKADELAGEKQKLLVQDLKNKYDAAREKIEQAQKHLKELPPRLPVEQRPFWAVATATIVEELTFDTLPRLDTFLSFAQQHVRELDGNTKPAQTTEEVLALAVSGWLQGDKLAEPDVKNATRLFRARLMLREYLKTDGEFDRAKVLEAFSKDNEVSAEVMSRILRTLPPVSPPEKVSAREPMQFSIETSDTVGGAYLVQAPPEYNPYRPYPVLLAVPSSRDKPRNMLQRLQELGAHHGFLLVTPLLGKDGKGAKGEYGYTLREQAVVIDMLRDLRRRFNVDSDRVFLFGWEDGGTMAFDIGLSHPHCFAGVLPMNGSAAKFPVASWSNAQQLPFYVVEGDFNGRNLKDTRDLTSKWVKLHYPAIYVEYKGRASEWYFEELITMFDWMSKKKRAYPARHVGIASTTGRGGEEFRTLRDGDNRFYWIGTDSIDPRNVNDPGNWQKFTPAATLQANISIGNEGGAKQARIWNQINVRTSGVKQVTLWLAPNMIDFTKPVAVMVNGRPHGQQRLQAPSLETMLEEFYHTGDRQQLFYAKINLKI